jgi:hypothetical protein
MNWEGSGRKCWWPNLRYLFGGTEKTQEKPQVSWCRCRNSNQLPPKYKIISVTAFLLQILSLFLPFFLLLPLWTTGHPWNALFHFSFLILRQSAGLLGREISPSPGRYLHKHRINAHRHPCLEWDSNPRSQRWGVHALDRAATVIGPITDYKW